MKEEGSNKREDNLCLHPIHLPLWIHLMSHDGKGNVNRELGQKIENLRNGWWIWRSPATFPFVTCLPMPTNFYEAMQPYRIQCRRSGDQCSEQDINGIILIPSVTVSRPFLLPSSSTPINLSDSLAPPRSNMPPQQTARLPRARTHTVYITILLHLLAESSSSMNL